MTDNDQSKIIDKNKLILVEGKDDKLFIKHLLKYRNINDVFIEPFNGKDKLTAHIKSLIKRDGFDDVTSIIILRDSDESYKSSSDSVNYSLRINGLITTDIKPFTISEQNNRRIGFALFPGIDENGTLEDLCLKIFKTDSNNAMVKKYLEDFQAANGRFKKPHKNELHVMFSFTDKYVSLLIGQVAESGGFDLDSPHLLPFIEMINKME